MKLIQEYLWDFSLKWISQVSYFYRLCRHKSGKITLYFTCFAYLFFSIATPQEAVFSIKNKTKYNQVLAKLQMQNTYIVYLDVYNDLSQKRHFQGFSHVINQAQYTSPCLLQALIKKLKIISVKM